MKQLMNALLITALAVGGMGLMTPAMAAEGQGMGQGMGHMQGMGSGMGMGMGMGMKHGMGDGPAWKATLSEAQKKQLDKLKLAYKQQVYPIKAKIKQAKIELALLITADNPKQDQINQKIDQIVKLKAEKMRLKAAHKIQVRSILNEEQRVQFDLMMLKKAYHGKKGHGRGHH